MTGIYRTNAELESKINKNSQIARDFYDKYKYLLSKEDETAIKNQYESIKNQAIKDGYYKEYTIPFKKLAQP